MTPNGKSADVRSVITSAEKPLPVDNNESEVNKGQVKQEPLEAKEMVVRAQVSNGKVTSVTVVEASTTQWIAF